MPRLSRAEKLILQLEARGLRLTDHQRAVCRMVIESWLAPIDSDTHAWRMRARYWRTKAGIDRNRPWDEAG